jgi:Ca-activated chloride channel homolog
VRSAVRRRAHAVVAVAGLMAVLVAACSPSPGGTEPSAAPSAGGAATGAAPPATRLEAEVTLRVLASNELNNMQEVLGKAQEATNVKLDMTYVDTPAGAATVGSGDQQYDAVWFDSNAYIALQPEAKRWVATSTKIMTSPVAFGLDPGVAKKLGWDKKAPTWSDIARAAGKKKFSYGMSDPVTSNPAFAALANVATALADTGSALQADQIDAVASDLRRFFSAQSMTAESAGFLADRFVARAGRAGAPQGLINYESTLIALNQSGRLKKPLTVVFPITLLNAVSDEARAGYRAVTNWLRSPEAQQLIMDTTARRPVISAVKPDKERFGDRLLIELPFPSRRKVLDRLLNSYLNSTRQLTQSIYVLDLSGSMEGDRIEQLREAMISLAGGQGRIKSSGYAVFRARERVTLIGYGDRVLTPRTFTVPSKDRKAGLARIRNAARDLDADQGNTATYSALRRAYQEADQQIRANPDAITSIVLMTDGEQNQGIQLSTFRAFYDDLRPAAKAVPTFPVQFGDAPRGELSSIARLTGGKLFSVEDTKLATAFRQIRAYQ